MQKLRTMAASLILLTCARAGWSDNWPSWRGPNQDGVAPGTGYPTTWSEDSNIVWKVEIPGVGTSTPAIWEDRIFLTCTDEEKNALICLNRKGEKQWLVHFGPTAGNRNRKASGANPSAVTDGEYVYCYYRSGDVACVDFTGNIVWQTNLQTKYGKDQLWWDLGTSPVLTKDAVVIAVMHQGPSYLVAMDKKTGREIWKQDRMVPAPGEARDSYTTPLVLEDADGSQMLVVLGADHVTAHDAATGVEIWRVGGLNPRQQGNFRSIASPVVVGELLIAPYERGKTLNAIRLGGKGDVTKTHVAWSIEIPGSDVPTPVAHDGKIYLCSDRGTVTCHRAEDGEKIWEHELPRGRYAISASPVLADGLLYVARENATVYVLKVGDKPEVVAANSLREYTYASPVLVDQQLYLRTTDFLFRIGADQ